MLSGVCPVTGASTQPKPQGVDALREQATQLVSTLFAGLGAGAGAGPGKQLSSLAHEASKAPLVAPLLGQPGELLGPLARSRAPSDPLDELRRQAHEFIETLLITFNDATGEKGLPAEDQVPLLTAVSAVQAGDVARASLRVVNDEPTPSDVTLYSTNFVADAGYEIASLHVRPSPRTSTIPGKSEATFQIEVAIPQQTPAGWYSALIQASGCKYVKAVLSIEVL